MEFRFTPAVIFLALSLYLVHSAVAMPRTPEKLDDVSSVDQSIEVVALEKTLRTTTTVPVPDTKVPAGRVACQFEEATEESICQEHCLPKGYNYGLCVNYTCSCI